MRRVALALSILLLTGIPILATEPAPSSLAAGQPRTLTFEDRVAAQRAIEEVYWRHRIWPTDNPTAKPPLDAVMPADVVRAKVEDYLKKSNALEKFWSRPLAAEQLQAEMDRMAKQTHDPDTLQELFAALGNDPFLIAETLARQTLADRLIRNWYAYDSRFHGELKRRVDEELARTGSVAGMKGMGGTYSEVTLRLRTDGETAPAIIDRPEREHDISSDDWGEQVSRIAARFGALNDAIPTNRLSRVLEEQDGLQVTALLRISVNLMTVATVRWAKTPFEAWWNRENSHVDTVTAPLSKQFLLVAPRSGGCVDDTWSATAARAPGGRAGHTAVWTGAEMIVWGGSGSGISSSGGRYDPATDAWTSISTAGAPFVRSLHTAVWTGSRMIVWGGGSSNTGGLYDPAADSWVPTSTGPNVPEGRSNHTAVWTGTEMIVWGGRPNYSGAPVYFNTGGRYDPSTDTWVPTSTGTGVPSPRLFHTAVWTGNEMIVWGGREVSQDDVNSGGRYNPTSDSWVSTSTGANVPSPRISHATVWTGEEMIVWGGSGTSNTALDIGGRYNPTSDSWVPTSPWDPHASLTAVWTGTEMIVWGGGTNTGGLYNPDTNSGSQRRPERTSQLRVLATRLSGPAGK